MVENRIQGLQDSGMGGKVLQLGETSERVGEEPEMEQRGIDVADDIGEDMIARPRLGWCGKWIASGWERGNGEGIGKTWQKKVGILLILHDQRCLLRHFFKGQDC